MAESKPALESNPATPANRLDQELVRLTFVGIVIASFFAAANSGSILKSFLKPTGAQLATTVLGLSAGFAFAYLLSAASALKYQSPRRIDRFPLSAKVGRFFYDASINIFGVYILILLVAWVDSRWLHLPHSLWVWPVYLALFSITYFVARVIWALAQRGIIAYYDAVDERERQLAHKSPRKPKD